MEVTDEMVYAAVKQAVKDDILPKYGTEEAYMHYYESVRRMLEAALNEYSKP